MQNETYIFIWRLVDYLLRRTLVRHHGVLHYGGGSTNGAYIRGEMVMDERIKELAEQAGYKHPKAVGMCEDFAYFNIERFAELVEQWARADERKVIDGIFDKAFKNQKDAERYMHLKNVLIDVYKMTKDIDVFCDNLIRSYDE